MGNALSNKNNNIILMALLGASTSFGIYYNYNSIKNINQQAEYLDKLVNKKPKQIQEEIEQLSKSSTLDENHEFVLKD